MDIKSRDAALKDFREDNDCRILLMSLKAAGVALNLTVASECFLLDLWWNPAAELQVCIREKDELHLRFAAMISYEFGIILLHREGH